MSDFAVMTPNEAAERWRIHPDTVRLMCQRGEIKAYKFGSAWRIPIEENERFYQPKEVKR